MDGIISTVEELGKHFGKSDRTIRRWIAAGMPVLSDGRFDLPQVAAWRKRKKGVSESRGDEKVFSQLGNNAEASGEHSPGTTEEDKDYWDKQSKKMQALHRQMMLRKAQGELIERKSVEDMFIARILEVKSLLLGFERLLPPELVLCRTDREMSMVIRKFTRRALSQFSRPLPESMKPLDANQNVN